MDRVEIRYYTGKDKMPVFRVAWRVVPQARLELARLDTESRDFKSRASTNFATRAYRKRILKYFRYPCQSIFVLMCLAMNMSCSILLPREENDGEDADPEETFIVATPQWFEVPERFTSRTKKDKYHTHAFFDLSSNLGGDDTSIDYVLLTPVKSEFYYDFDLVSGKKYQKFRYCPQKDIWQNYQGAIDRPPFSEGIIPRLLNRRGRPQRIWVFGDPYFLKDKAGEQDISQNARVLGGIILQYCARYPCREKGEWQGSPVLVAVNDLDPNMRGIKTLSELKFEVDWDYVKAFAQNGFGRGLLAFGENPAYRIVGEVEAEEILDFISEHGHYFEPKEIVGLKKNCFHLYDYIWNSVQRIRLSTREQKEKDKSIIQEPQVTSDDTLLVRLKQIEVGLGKSNVVKDDANAGITGYIPMPPVTRPNKSKARPDTDWPLFFQHFHQNYRDRFLTCQKYVRPSNISHDHKRHWFFAYLAAFIHLEELGQSYDCLAGAWNRSENRATIERKESCTTSKLNLAFTSSIGVLKKLASLGQEHLRYITYDSGIGASREKIYNWAYADAKDLSCVSGKSKPLSKSIFPENVKWDNFETPQKQENQFF